MPAFIFVMVILVGICVYLYTQTSLLGNRRREYNLFESLGYNVGRDPHKPDFTTVLVPYALLVKRHLHAGSTREKLLFDEAWKSIFTAWHAEVIRTQERPTLYAVIAVAKKLYSTATDGDSNPYFDFVKSVLELQFHTSSANIIIQ